MCNYCKECSPNPYRHGVQIRKVAKECYNALILLRSANKSNERNPIPIGFRKALIGGHDGHDGHEGSMMGMMMGYEGYEGGCEGYEGTVMEA